MVKTRILTFLLLLWPLIYGPSFAAIPALWGTTSTKKNILFVESNPSHSLSQLDARLVKAMKAGEILVLANTPSLSEIEKEIRDYYQNAGKSVLTLDVAPPSGGIEQILSLIQEHRDKKIVTVLGSDHYKGKQGVIPPLKQKKMTFTSFEAIPLWPVYVPSHHWSPPSLNRARKPLPAPDMTRLTPILPRPLPEIPTPPPPEIIKQPTMGLGSPFYRHHFRERSGKK